LIEKFRTNLARIYSVDQQKRIEDATLDRAKLEQMSVIDFTDLLAKP